MYIANKQQKGVPLSADAFIRWLSKQDDSKTIGDVTSRYHDPFITYLKAQSDLYDARLWRDQLILYYTADDDEVILTDKSRLLWLFNYSYLGSESKEAHLYPADIVDMVMKAVEAAEAGRDLGAEADAAEAAAETPAPQEPSSFWSVIEDD